MLFITDSQGDMAGQLAEGEYDRPVAAFAQGGATTDPAGMGDLARRIAATHLRRPSRRRTCSLQVLSVPFPPEAAVLLRPSPLQPATEQGAPEPLPPAPGATLGHRAQDCSVADPLAAPDRAAMLTPDASSRHLLAP